MTMRAVWESPTNEGTSYYEIGQRKRQIPGSFDSKRGGHQYEWEVGRIIMEPSEIRGVDFGARIIVIDAEGGRRVSLPAATCGWEWFDPADDNEEEKIE